MKITNQQKKKILKELADIVPDLKQVAIVYGRDKQSETVEILSIEIPSENV